MFTGIVQEIGVVSAIRRRGEGAQLSVRCSSILQGLREGDSVSVDGACLTVVEIQSNGFLADVVEETLRRTIIGTYRVGTRVNLEPSLRVGDALGGHLVLGHVDAVAETRSVHPVGEGKVAWFRVPESLRRFIAEKGSVAVNGVSLTVAEIDGADFAVALVPFTLEKTNLGLLRPGMPVNVEVDVLARYVERLLEGEGGRLTLAQLREMGYE